MLASEEYARRGSDAVPWGLCHAVSLEDGTTACGRPARSLRVWREFPWERAGMLGVERCEVCAKSEG